ncbi:MAG: alkaline phosphatase family protein, partial [Bacteroidota bacterium]
SFTNTHFNYIPTYTGPGHASVYTGTTPATHGIIANHWYDRASGEVVYCVDNDGKAGPKRLQSSTMTDELKRSLGDSAKVISISIKDRGAILPGGQQPDAAYWYDYDSGKWKTNDHYRAGLPDWVVEFHARNLPDAYLSHPWETIMPLEMYTASRADDSPHEAPFVEGAKPVFPYDVPALFEKKGYGLLPYIPAGNSFTAEFAKAAVLGEQLGQDGHTDFLAVSFSSTDKIGHQFGPMAIELQDTYLRFDRDLEALLNFLDAEVGKGEYLLFLTSDHGVVEVPGYRMEEGISGGYLSKPDLTAALKTFLEKELGGSGWIDNISNHQVFLNTDAMADAGVNADDVAAQVAARIQTIEGVAEAYPASAFATLPESQQGQQVFRGFRADMSGNVAYVLEPGWLESEGRQGTSHGSGYAYDTHAPLLWFGWEVPQGENDEYVTITRIAPTVSRLINIGLPDGCQDASLEFRAGSSEEVASE